MEPASADLSSALRIAPRFGWTKPFVSPAPGGHIHQTFFVGSEQGDFVLQRLNREVFSDLDAMTRNLLTVRESLAGDLVAQPVASADGEWLVERAEERWRAFVRVPDSWPVAAVDEGVAQEAGALLGRFHSRTARLDPARLAETIPGFHDPRRRLGQLRRAAASDPLGRAPDVGPELEVVAEAAHLVELCEDLVSATPERVAHNDAKLDNMLFRDGAAVCLTDLDTLMPGRWFWDLGDLLRTAATTSSEDDVKPTVSVDRSLYDAVLRGYLSEVSEGHLERSEFRAAGHAGAIVTYEQATRFLTDWLEGDRYYRTTRPGQNLDRARCQLRLLATFPGSRSPS